MAALIRALALTGVPLLVLVILAERVITTRALRPLEDVTRRADSASAEAGVRSLGEPVGIDEVDRLTAAFNRLLTGLDDARMLERRFAADASHELRTPLTVLLGELELAGSSVPPGTAAAESIASAGAQARRMNDLVDALLLLRRLNEEGTRPAGEFETVNLADVARDVCRAELAARPDRAGDLRLSAPDEIHVLGHPSLLASAMTNLVDNALKFTRGGDAVEVTLEAVDGEVRAVVTDARARRAARGGGPALRSVLPRLRGPGQDPGLRTGPSPPPPGGASPRRRRDLPARLLRRRLFRASASVLGEPAADGSPTRSPPVASVPPVKLRFGLGC